MEKTINCADCGEDYTYNEREGFPRKYCGVCGAQRKKSFAAIAKPQKPIDVTDAYEDVNNGEMPVKVEKIYRESAEKAVDKAYPKKNGDFHLSPEQVRSNALASAMNHIHANDVGVREILDLARKFEKYLLGEDE